MAAAGAGPTGRSLGQGLPGRAVRRGAGRPAYPLFGRPAVAGARLLPEAGGRGAPPPAVRLRGADLLLRAALGGRRRLACRLAASAPGVSRGGNPPDTPEERREGTRSGRGAVAARQRRRRRIDMASKEQRERDVAEERSRGEALTVLIQQQVTHALGRPSTPRRLH